MPGWEKILLFERESRGRVVKQVVQSDEIRKAAAKEKLQQKARTGQFIISLEMLYYTAL